MNIEKNQNLKQFYRDKEYESIKLEERKLCNISIEENYEQKYKYKCKCEYKYVLKYRYKYKYKNYRIDIKEDHKQKCN